MNTWYIKLSDSKDLQKVTEIEMIKRKNSHPFTIYNVLFNTNLTTVITSYKFHQVAAYIVVGLKDGWKIKNKEKVK